MDPGWPENPLDSIVCILCKSVMPFVNQNSENFFRHLMKDHTAYYNLNLLLEISQMQPQAVREETQEAPQRPLIKLEPHSPDSPPPSSPELEQESKRVKREKSSKDTIGLDPVSLEFIDLNEGGGIEFSTEGAGIEFSTEGGGIEFSLDEASGAKDATNKVGQKNPFKKLKDRKQEKKKPREVEDFDLGFFITQINKPEPQAQGSQNMLPPAPAANTFIPFPFAPREPTDFSLLDPISLVKQERKPGRRGPRRQEVIEWDGFGMPANPNQHLVPEDLQKLIISSNPNRMIKFTYSQRLNTQLVMDDFIMKKKKGPYMSKGGRTCCWKCSHELCTYTVITWEGAIQDSKQHNHPPQPELYHKKQARFKLREDLAGGQESLVSNVVSQIMDETVPEQRDMLGSVDALKQAARRYSRKLRGIVPVPRSPPQPALGYTARPGDLLPGPMDLPPGSVDLPPSSVDTGPSPGDVDMDPFIQSLSSESTYEVVGSAHVEVMEPPYVDGGVWGQEEGEVSQNINILSSRTT